MRIAIIGAHPATRLDAPYKDPDWTIWACSSKNMDLLPRWDAWFELHIPLGADKYVNWLRPLPLVYVRGEAPLPGAARYPETEMKARFGPYFFTSTAAHMMALAIAQQPKQIGLWGVSMITGEEYAYQRPGCHYFTQRARELGIEVTVPPRCGLLEPPKEQW